MFSLGFCARRIAEMNHKLVEHVVMHLGILATFFMCGDRFKFVSFLVCGFSVASVFLPGTPQLTPHSVGQLSPTVMGATIDK